MGVRFGDRPIETDPGEIDQILFDSSKDIWTLEPEEGSAGQALLASYFAGGSPTFRTPLAL